MNFVINEVRHCFSQDAARKNSGLELDMGVPLVWGVFLYIFSLLLQEQIHLGVELGNPLNTPMVSISVVSTSQK